VRNIFISVPLNLGTITGGIIGLNTGKYDNCCFDKYEKEKTDKVKKILKIKR